MKKTEALAAIAGPTMRPSALEAATKPMPDDDTGQLDGTVQGEDGRPSRPQEAAHATVSEHANKPSHTPEQSPTPFGQQTDGTEIAAKVVEAAVHGMKVAVEGAVAWAEKKVEELGSKTDNTGPYASPATCAPSDMDPISSGVLPAMPSQQNENTAEHVNEKDGEENANEGAEMKRPEAEAVNQNPGSKN
jgi:hypothetical protein